MIANRERQINSYMRHTSTNLPYNSTTPFLGIYPKELKSVQGKKK